MNIDENVFPKVQNDLVENPINNKRVKSEEIN